MDSAVLHAGIQWVCKDGMPGGVRVSSRRIALSSHAGRAARPCGIGCFLQIFRQYRASSARVRTPGLLVASLSDDGDLRARRVVWRLLALAATCRGAFERVVCGTRTGPVRAGRQSGVAGISGNQRFATLCFDAGNAKRTHVDARMCSFASSAWLLHACMHVQRSCFVHGSSERDAPAQSKTWAVEPGGFRSTIYEIQYCYEEVDLAETFVLHLYLDATDIDKMGLNLEFELMFMEMDAEK
eukprot:352421-Chlamydomonas_euryale.AAC.75